LGADDFRSQVVFKPARDAEEKAEHADNLCEFDERFPTIGVAGSQPPRLTTPIDPAF
jgi:hypothetical protein